MSDIKEIMRSVLSDEKLLSSKAFRDKVYTDQPILRPASQLRRPETPQKIKEMKSLAFSPEAYWKTSAWLFYTQGKFMENYTDDFAFSGEFTSYYPTYRDLDNDQLRGYFSWRTAVRNGIVNDAPMPFAFIYMYELINGIGWTEPASGLELLDSFCRSYSVFNPAINKYWRQWTADMAAYYQLPPELLSDHPDIQWDKNVIALQNWEMQSDEELYAAISGLSGYPPENSRYFTEYPDIFFENTVACFRKLSEFFRDHRKRSLCSHLFGNPTEMTYHMFESAVFYDRESLRSCDYSFNSIHSFTCTNGVWRCRKYYGNRSRNKLLGNIIKSVDSALRDRYDYRFKLRTEDVSKSILTIISKEVQRIYEVHRRAEAPKIEIDLSRLETIRKAADITRDKLIVDEDIQDEQPAPTEPQTVPDLSVTENDILDCGETAFMQALLTGSDWKQAAKDSGSMPSILADSINEKLFDLFGDTVIDFSDDCPVLIEDYTDELKGLFRV
ncbi:MAG: TerB N-terminal domain-containing protein [Ruminococcus sp.]|nr:TerB N-terminal domain-containing protein [Ruminococcus sp.]